MTASVQLSFANKQSIALPNDTASHTLDLTDTLDQGALQVPPFGTVAIPKDIGNGGVIPIFASATFPPAAKAEYKFNFLTSPDNTTWTTLSSNIADNSSGDGVQRVPSGVMRYMKMQIVYKCTVAPGANKVATVNADLGNQVSNFF
ncbi:hypothetical protein BJAS_P3963 [Bathymodiolus japonicus methanotrophic gill symbiont]|uniref:hypothetical protein n=1 Tax=Bathymodiolus japonicus methanotrophic gill symbiont TaxID=113269 RepID=UPI001B3DCB72|nr:hypothetical protein [Bathymodiolus japonicus methanotrophic gill symbiont]GFO73251.1 hypothetical protein BJAS_P3963 [Bathymodiolus japonicus methanotrophic gill symbiont]